MTNEYKAMLYSVMWQLDSAYNILSAMAKDVKEDGEELEAACRHLNAIDGILLRQIGHYVPEMERYI